MPEELPVLTETACIGGDAEGAEPVQKTTPHGGRAVDQADIGGQERKGGKAGTERRAADPLAVHLEGHPRREQRRDLDVPFADGPGAEKAF